jgi:Uma2 family endonuclease
MTTVLAEERPRVEEAELTEAPPRPFHWTVEAYYRAWNAGAFGHDPSLELIHGEIIENMSPAPLHTSLGNIIADLLRTILPDLTVRVEGAVHIDFDGEPIPDVTVVIGTNRDYLKRHPGPAEVMLLVEVALSSADYDLGGKALLYSQANISDYWVVLPERGHVVVHRHPTPNGFASVTTLGTDGEVAPLVSDQPLAVADLLGLHLDETEAE